MMQRRTSHFLLVERFLSRERKHQGDRGLASWQIPVAFCALHLFKGLKPLGIGILFETRQGETRFEQGGNDLSDAPSKLMNPMGIQKVLDTLQPHFVEGKGRYAHGPTSEIRERRSQLARSLPLARGRQESSDQ